MVKKAKKWNEVVQIVKNNLFEQILEVESKKIKLEGDWFLTDDKIHEEKKIDS